MQGFRDEKARTDVAKALVLTHQLQLQGKVSSTSAAGTTVVPDLVIFITT
jgi:hypothetical protein